MTLAKAHKILINLLLVVLGITFVNVIVSYFTKNINFRYIQLYSEKLEQVKNSPSDISLVFIGTSRFIHGFKPEAIDKNFDKIGIKVKSYNMALHNMALWEQDKILSDLSEIKGFNPKFIILEPLFRLGTEITNVATSRNIYFSDYTRAKMAQSFILSSKRDHLRKGYNLFMNQLGFVYHCVNYGIFSDIFFPHEMQYIQDESLENILKENGYQKIPFMEGGKVINPKFLEIAPKMLEQFIKNSEVIKQQQIALNQTELFFFQNLAKKHSDSDTKVIFLLPPVLNIPQKFYRERIYQFLYAANQPESGIRLLSYLDFEKIPELYHANKWSNFNHLNDDGAEVFSSLFVNDFKQYILQN